MALWRPGKEIVLLTNPIGRKLLNGLTGYWPLDEASGTRADQSGNVLTLTDNNSVLSVAGPSSKLPVAALFDGVNQSLSRTSSALLQTGNIDFTVRLWVRPTTIAGVGVFQTIAGKGSGVAGSIEWQLYTGNNNGVVRFLVSSDGTATTTVTTSNALVAGQWSHVCAWHDAVNDTVNVQVDGGPVASSAYASGLTALTGVLTLAINGDLAAAPFACREAGVLFSKRIWSAQERAYDYNNGNGRQLVLGRGLV